MAAMLRFFGVMLMLDLERFCRATAFEQASITHGQYKRGPTAISNAPRMPISSQMRLPFRQVFAPLT